MGIIKADQDVGCFVVLLGIDGSGKSSLLSQLARAGITAKSWHELRSHDVPATLAPEAPTAIKSRLSPLSRAMFIGGHLVAQYEYLVRPALAQGTTVVLDSYYFKLLAKEHLLGYAHPSLVALCRELPQPDAVIFIDTPAKVSYARKAGALSPYEHFGEPSETTFVRFQDAIAVRLRESARALPHVTLDGTSPPAFLLASALDALDGFVQGERAS